MTIAESVALLAGYFLFSAAVGAMLPPAPGKERGAYGWLYRFLQRVAANADRIAEARLHGLSDLPGVAGSSGADAGTVIAGSRSTTTTEHTDVAVITQGNQPN